MTGSTGFALPYTVSAVDICRQLSMATVSNSSARSLIQNFRILSIEMWAPRILGTPSGTCGVLWNIAANGTGYEISDTTLSDAYPAHIKSSPPHDSSSGFWNTLGNGVMFSVYGAAGLIIDLTIEYTLLDSTASAAFSISATNVGQVGATYLDANAGTNQLVPVTYQLIV